MPKIQFKFQEVLVYIILFCLPLLVFPFGISYFELPKVFASELLIELLAISLLLTVTSSFWRISSQTNFILLGLLIISLIDLIFMPGQDYFFGNGFRLQGIFLFWHLMLLTFLASRLKEQTYHWLGYLIPILILLGSTFIFGSNQDNRIVGTLGEPNALGAVALFYLPFIYLTNSQNKIKIILIFLGTIISLYIITVSGSKSALLGFVIEATFLLPTMVFNFSVKKTLILCLIILLLSLTAPFFQKELLFENRSEVWTTAWNAGLQKPILGWGIGNTQTALHETSKIINNNIQYQVVDSSHNIFLDFWVQTGVTGLAFFITLVIISFKNFLTSKNLLYLTLLLGLLTTASFNPLSVVSLVAFWWVIGQGLK